jgi:hypothetical protein
MNKYFVIISVILSIVVATPSSPKGTKETSATTQKTVAHNYSASERSYGNQTMGIVSFKGHAIMRLIHVNTDDGSILKRVQKIADALNINVNTREATQKISLTTSGNTYTVASDGKFLFNFYTEDVMFNGVNNARLLKSWITNMTRLMDQTL